MTSHCNPISYKKYSLMLIAPLSFIAILIWAMEAYFGTLYGDLTRIGQLDEGDFGWRVQQPAVPANLLKSYFLPEADTLIIGDSFSSGLIWQSRLVAAGFKPSTLLWNNLKPCGLGKNLGEVIRQAGFNGRHLIIENVERGFEDRVASSCDITGKIKDTAFNGTPPATAPPNDHWQIFSDKEPLGGDWVIHALINKIKLAYFFNPSAKDMEFGNGTRIVPIDGCRLFSNRLCDYGLFFSQDFGKKTFRSIDTVVALDHNLKKVGIDAIWLVIPDKATVYLGYGKLNVNPYENVWDTFAKYPELKAPHLGEMFMRQSRQAIDFYDPNNTHLSTSGYLYLGDLMVNFLAYPKDIPAH